ncbi:MULTISPECIES: TetR family transcriptional regulator [unclassified Streptomyces]|uniref:TetR/AcrR family transcriptional regulator n=1 Tax=unclassified Streptomyces TaxID=2593676 RepID=UPI000FA2B2DA|nr:MULTISPECIES: TetR family transcriptional regulator [unclassified Streptomyces]WSG53007.1 TetR family transcriptional regulator [Streptomyces sp. NBC_01732]WSX03650.1 TetR family transcriptional regulator [Streptomyces sp. NBC_00987]MCX4394334.1 TetR family transcriptional regulator [Streptomyces sp. NBC_01767]MCX5106283.1 TetR family transcriptional regulator [Streptomyces sp. NBC_00439]MCX5162579.1 TetR family transcriptional regulator [Streptomyces sp. NBC_00305]
MAVTSRTPSVSAPGTPPQPGLRERKKLRTRIAIRQAAYRLIAEQGYEATTVEQIAAAAEVSPSTVFRYFPAKEDIVLTDEYDGVLAAALRGRPAGEPPLESLRHVLAEVLAEFLATGEQELRQRTRLMVEVPAVRARTAGSMSDTAGALADALAARTGREPGDLAVRVFVAAVLGTLREVTLCWGEQGQEGDLVAMTGRALDILEGGLRL